MVRARVRDRTRWPEQRLAHLGIGHHKAQVLYVNARVYGAQVVEELVDNLQVLLFLFLQGHSPPEVDCKLVDVADRANAHFRVLGVPPGVGRSDTSFGGEREVVARRTQIDDGTSRGVSAAQRGCPDSRHRRQQHPLVGAREPVVLVDHLFNSFCPQVLLLFAQ